MPRINTNNITSKRRTRKTEYDFATERASAGRAAIHDYPAMLHYLLVRDLISKYGTANSVIYDPFCGSGVTIIEALRNGNTVFGTDINPLALLIAEVRTLQLSTKVLDLEFAKILDNFSSTDQDIPIVKNIEYWFQPGVIFHLGKLRKCIKNIKDENVGKFFKIVFSQTVRDVSNNRKGEFKRFRLSQIKLSAFNPDVLGTFNKIFNKYKIIIETDLKGNDFKLYKHDVREILPFNTKIDLVITSPPYGDSRTTVAYGQFSSFSMDWLNGLNPYGNEDLKLDSKMLGGKLHFKTEFESNTLDKTLKKLQNEKRKKEVEVFFSDLYQSCKQIISILNQKAIVCFVVGNRLVGGVVIPMDAIIKEFFISLGLVHEQTLIRKISNKRMPSKNSPSNIRGELSSTMTNEYIVIMRK